ncbi:ESCRT-0 subunit protein [Martiniozyma asiatica (nom. inval.)]|nr:ESCRT-0 subunit protein [Martiniozyma asiatica]
MSLEPLIDHITSANLEEDDLQSLLDLIEIVNNNPSENVPEAFRLLKVKLQSSNANTLLRSLTLLDFFAQNCGALMKAQIATQSFVDSSLLPIINDSRMHISVKFGVVKEMYKLVKAFHDDESLNVMQKSFAKLQSGAYRSLCEDAKNDVDGKSKPSLPPRGQDEEGDDDADLKRAIELSLQDSGRSAMPQQQQQQQLQQSNRINIPQVQISAPNMQNTNSMAMPLSPVAQQLTGNSMHSFNSQIQMPPLQENINMPAKVIALFDLDTDDADTLSFKRDDIITVVETINEDWIRGCLHGQAGIIPTNYVKPIPKTLESDLRDLTNSLDQSFNIESTLSKLLDLSKKIKTTPMTSQQFEKALTDNQFPIKMQKIEEMKIKIKNVIDLQKLKILELDALKSNMDESLNVYQDIMGKMREEGEVGRFMDEYPDISNLTISQGPALFQQQTGAINMQAPPPPNVPSYPQQQQQDQSTRFQGLNYTQTGNSNAFLNHY